VRATSEFQLLLTYSTSSRQAPPRRSRGLIMSWRFGGWAPRFQHRPARQSALTSL